VRPPVPDASHHPAALDRPEAPPFALVGFVCGRYRLEAPLGRGGLGEVYRARDLQFDRTVAVKVLFDSVFEGADAFDSLMREVSLVDRVSHPNVVRVYDVIRFEGRVAIVMEYVSGQSLAAITRDQGTVTPEDFDAVLTGVAEALDAAHAAGVVHGDVTPGNVLITDEGKVKLCDFGVGRLVGDDPSAPRAGTPRFVAPEVLAGADAGPRADVYSLGALTLHMIAGRNADVATLPVPFARALEGALEPEPNMRCASAGALAVAFHSALEDEILRRRGPVRRLLDGFRLRSTRKANHPQRVEIPPTVNFPMLHNREAAFLDDPDRTQPLAPPSDSYMEAAASVTQALRTHE
jgi:serine/threonine protein kinase